MFRPLVVQLQPGATSQDQTAYSLLRYQAWNTQGIEKVVGDHCTVPGHRMGCDQEGCAALPAGRLTTI